MVYRQVWNALLTIDSVREAVSKPEAGYALEVEVLPSNGNLGLFNLGRDFPLNYYAGARIDEPLLLPRLEVGPQTEFNSIIELVHRDLHDAVGQRRFPIEIPANGEHHGESG